MKDFWGGISCVACMREHIVLHVLYLKQHKHMEFHVKVLTWTKRLIQVANLQAAWVDCSDLIPLSGERIRPQTAERNWVRPTSTHLLKNKGLLLMVDQIENIKLDCCVCVFLTCCPGSWGLSRSCFPARTVQKEALLYLQTGGTISNHLK